MRKKTLLSVLCRRQTFLSETVADMPGISVHKVIKRFLGIALVCLCFAAQAWGELTVASEGFPTEPESQALSFVPTAPAEPTIITVTSTGAWTATKGIEDTWITLTGASGASSGTFTVTVTSNTTGAVRSGTITVASEGETPQEITVTQAAAQITLSLESITSAAIIERTITVTANVAWTAETTIGLIFPPASSNGNVPGGETFQYLLGPNYEDVPRSGTITVSGTGEFAGVSAAIPVTQEALSLSVEAEGLTEEEDGTMELEVAARGIEPDNALEFTVTANASWTVDANCDWITIPEGSYTTPVSGNKFTISVSPNMETESRTGTITIRNYGPVDKSWTITVTQDASPSLTLTGPGLSDEIDGTQHLESSPQGIVSRTVTVATDIEWTVSEDTSDDWITVTRDAPNGNTFTIAVSTNTGNQRTGIITVAGTDELSYLKKTITVTQEEPYISITSEADEFTEADETTPASIAFGPTASSDEPVEITVHHNIFYWEATESEEYDWITVTKDEPYGNTFTIAVSPNTTGGERTGTITVAGTLISFTGLTQTITVTQAPAQIELAEAENDELSFGAFELVTKTVELTANIAWTATVAPASDWLTFTTSGAGSGTFTVTVTAANTTDAEREATITIAGTGAFTDVTEPITVTQAAPITFTDGDLSYIATGLATVAVTGLEDDATDILIPATVTVGEDEEAVTYAVTSIAANAFASSDITSVSIPASVATVGTDAFKGCTDLASVEVKWATPTVANETGITAAFGGVTVSEVALIVPIGTAEAYGADSFWGTFNAPTEANTLLVSSTAFEEGTQELSYGPTGAEEVAITVTSNVEWTATASDTWITLSENISREDGDEEVLILKATIATFATTGEAREGTITVSGDDGLEQTITVTQAAPSITIEGIDVWAAAAANTEITVTANIAWTATVEPESDWLTITDGEGNGNVEGGETFAIELDEYTGEGNRTATITITGTDAGLTTVTETITITQTNAYLNVVETNLTVLASAGSKTITVDANIAWTADVDPADDWITLTPSAGNLLIAFTSYSGDGDPRTATITITGTGYSSISKKITVTQYEGYFTEANSNLTVLPSAGTKDVTVSANFAWTATAASTGNWLTATGNPEEGKLTIGFGAYSGDGEPRTGTITISYYFAQATITVTQYAPSIGVPATLSLGSSAGTQTVTVTANIAWAANVESDWLTITEDEDNGEGDGTFTITFAANTAATTTSARSATITVSATDEGLGVTPQTITVTQAGATVTPPTPPVITPTEVSLNQSSITLKTGNTQQLVAIVLPLNAANKSVTWTSSDATVATVANGVVTAVAPGTATITVTTAVGGYKATCTVTVTGSTTGIAKASEGVAIRSEAGKLYITSPAAETVYIYSFTGKLLYSATKASGLAIFNAPSEKLLIVRGTSGWARKVSN
jgi:hypothetical protein